MINETKKKQKRQNKSYMLHDSTYMTSRKGNTTKAENKLGFAWARSGRGV